MEGISRNRSELWATQHDNLGIDESTLQACEAILGPLPNDFTRVIYLASIRDYNSGTYRHPVLSRQYEATVADRGFKICHQEVFARLLANPISKYVEQLEGYIRYSRAERRLLIATWKSLAAYKAAIPSQAPARACELFFLNVGTALAILQLPLQDVPNE